MVTEVTNIFKCLTQIFWQQVYKFFFIGFLREILSYQIILLYFAIYLTTITQCKPYITKDNISEILSTD